MSCSPRFTNEISLTCIFGLIGDIKNGVDVQTIKKALWIAGCILEKVGPPTLPQGDDEVGLLDYVDKFDVLVGKLEAVAYKLAEQETEAVFTAQSPQVGTQGWEVFIPIILEIVKLIIENRKKKEQPVPALVPAHAPTTRPATAESYVDSPKKK